MEFDAQKMLDLYIHDYLVRNNMHTVAETFAQEANFQLKPVALGDGFLSDWWSIFWDVYCSRPENDPAAPTSMSCASVPPNPDPVSPLPDPNYIVQNIRPSMQNVIPTMVPRPLPSVEEPFWLPPWNLDPMLNALNSPPPYDPKLNALNSPPTYDPMLNTINSPPPYDPMLNTLNSPPPYDPMLNALNSPPPYDPMLAQLPNLPQAEAEMGSVEEPFRRNLDPMLNALNSPSPYDPTLAQLPNLPQAEAEMGSVEEPFLRNLDHMLNALNSPSPYDPTLAQLPNLPQAEAEMGSVEEPFRRNLDPTLNALNSPSPYDPTLAQLPNLPQAEAEMGSVDEPFWRNLDNMLNALSSPSPYDPTLAQLPNLPQAEPEMGSADEPSWRNLDHMLNALNCPPYDPKLAQLPNQPQADAGHPMKEMGSQQVHVRKPPRNPDPAIKAMSDFHQFSLRPEMGSSSYHINNWQQSPIVSRPHQSCASNALPVSPPPDPNIPLPRVEELDPMLNALNIPPPYDPTLAQLPNLPQAEMAVPTPEMGSLSYRAQRVNNCLQNRRRARNIGTGLRRPNTSVRTPPTQEIYILDTSAELANTGSSASSP